LAAKKNGSFSTQKFSGQGQGGTSQDHQQFDRIEPVPWTALHKNGGADV
jgi:hypothetical protein